MKRKKSFRQTAILIVLLMIFSCNNAKKYRHYSNGTFVYVNHYPNGKIEEEVALDKDSMPNGITKLYDGDGNLYRVTRYKHGIKEGTQYKYFENGKVYEVGKYNAGKKDSTWVTYYESGKINLIENWINDKNFGECFLYYPNGNLRQFSFSDFDGNTVYIRNYNQSGGIKSEDGFPIDVAYNRSHLNIGDSLDITLFLGLLDAWDVEVVFSDVSNGNSILLKNISNKNKFHYNQRHDAKIFTYKIPCRKKGVYKLKVDIDIFDPIYKRNLKHEGNLTYYVE